MIFIDAASLSFNDSMKPVEIYVPLWIANGLHTGTTATTDQLIRDGATSAIASTSADNSNRLLTLSAKIDPNTKFAFEVTLYSSNSSSGINAALWDFTTSMIVPYSNLASSSTSATVLRTTLLTLTPGRTYGVRIFASNSSYSVYLTDASLIIFP